MNKWCHWWSNSAICVWTTATSIFEYCFRNNWSHPHFSQLASAKSQASYWREKRTPEIHQQMTASHLVPNQGITLNTFCLFTPKEARSVVTGTQGERGEAFVFGCLALCRCCPPTQRHLQVPEFPSNFDGAVAKLNQALLSMHCS